MNKKHKETKIEEERNLLAQLVANQFGYNVRHDNICPVCDVPLADGDCSLPIPEGGGCPWRKQIKPIILRLVKEGVITLKEKEDE